MDINGRPPAALLSPLSLRQRCIAPVVIGAQRVRRRILSGDSVRLGAGAPVQDGYYDRNGDTLGERSRLAVWARLLSLVATAACPERRNRAFPCGGDGDDVLR